MPAQAKHAAGLRDKRVTIEQLSVEASGGFPTETWISLAVEWMSKAELGADERFASNQESAFAETAWGLAYRADMDPDLLDVPKKRRLVYQGRIFDIVAANPIGRERGIELLTLAGGWVQ
jgi:head-tail adaptor